MDTRMVSLGNCRFEVITDGDSFNGIGKVFIGETQVRSGRLPINIYTQTYSTNLELDGLRFLGIKEKADEVRINVEMHFRPLKVKLLRDHSFDPIHELGDWDKPVDAGTGHLTIVLRPATDCFRGAEFKGFSYHYEYHSDSVPVFYLLDMASWELDGDIVGATAYSQSSCSAPVAVFAPDTTWSTEGILHFLVEEGNQNPIMTHNLPRWVSHGSFDFQFKGDTTLIGIFDHVDLIRSIVCREAGKAELKHFDKHIFDETMQYSTSAKSVMINCEQKTTVAQQNLWTWIYDEVDRRARAEFGIKDEPVIPSISQNFWQHFTVDSYYKDLLPAAASAGIRRIFVDNLKKSSMTEQAPMPGVWNWNMCNGHEYEISDRLGGVKRVKAFVEEADKRNVQVMIWTNNDQALSSPLNKHERYHDGFWYVLLEDARQKWGGAYMGVMSILDLSKDEVRDYFVKSHLKIKEETGIDAIFFDSFYNLGFMPVSYEHCRPHTQWRGMLQVVRELQEGGCNFCIESFGAFGLPHHGHPSSYNMDNIFACYRVGLGNDYTTVPTANPVFGGHTTGPTADFFCLAHKAQLASHALFKDGMRIDEIWTDAQKRQLAVYHDVLPAMYTRFLQEDGKSVLWHDEDGAQATVWNFADREVELPGTITDLITGEVLPDGQTFRLQAWHVYAVTGVDMLPVLVTESVLSNV